MAVEKIKDLWSSVAALVISQFSQSQSLLSIASKVVNSLQSHEDAADQIYSRLNIHTASGAWLDLIGKIRNVKREKGQSDEQYRAEILDRLVVDYDGTASYAIKMARKYSGDEKPKIFEELPGVFFIYTPGGRQIERAFTARHTPAGVSGFPGAAICFADGSAMMDAGGKIFLAVADDAEIDGSTMLATEAGEILMTETGEMILIETEA